MFGTCDISYSPFVGILIQAHFPRPWERNPAVEKQAKLPLPVQAKLIYHGFSLPTFSLLSFPLPFPFLHPFPPFLPSSLLPSILLSSFPPFLPPFSYSTPICLLCELEIFTLALLAVPICAHFLALVAYRFALNLAFAY